MKTNIFNPAFYFYAFLWVHVLRRIGKSFAVAGVSLPRFEEPSSLALFYIKEGFEYKSDNFDYIKHWSAFYTQKRGDCDDFAEFAIASLADSKYTCKLLYLNKKKESHVVVLLESKGVFHIMDTTAHNEYKSFEAVLSYYKEDGYQKYLLL